MCGILAALTVEDFLPYDLLDDNDDVPREPAARDLLPDKTRFSESNPLARSPR